MTLVEVLAALAIFGMIGSVLYGGLSQTIQNKQTVEDELDRYHEIIMGVERVARELSMAYVSYQLYSNPNQALWAVNTTFLGKEEGGGSRIDFTSFSHRRLYRNAHESDQNELSYLVAENPENRNRKVLARREQNRIDDNPAEGGQTRFLIDNITAFNLRYLDPMTLEWQTTWDASWPGGMQVNRLPAQIEIKVTVPNIRGFGPDQVFGTRADLPLRYALNFAVYR